MSKSRAEFVPLVTVNDRVVSDFTGLLITLSKGFAAKDPDTQRKAVAKNLTAALNNPNAVVYVHRERGAVVSTLTTNKTPGVVSGKTEGWIDDVVTLPEWQRRGLGRAGMHAAHKALKSEGVSTVRLTSQPDRGGLYDNLGYEKGGTVWRAAIGGTIVRDTDPRGLLVPVKCTIPTGNKAWIVGPTTPDVAAYDLAGDMLVAHASLEREGVESVNYFSLDAPTPDMLTALGIHGYAPRDTRLYTLTQ